MRVSCGNESGSLLVSFVFGFPSVPVRHFEAYPTLALSFPHDILVPVRRSTLFFGCKCGSPSRSLAASFPYDIPCRTA